MEREHWFCLFREDGVPMAVPLESVAEVLKTERLVRLPWSPPRVVGLCPYHREVVPVVSMGVPAGGAGEGIASGPGPTHGADGSPEGPGIDAGARHVVLILRTEQGTWGVRADAENTIVSRESPDSHPPTADGSGRVLLGSIRRAATSYDVLDAEATWRELRSAVARWYGLISEYEACSLAACEAEPR
jgi:chemotaxis signal transduction protein